MIHVHVDMHIFKDIVRYNLSITKNTFHTPLDMLWNYERRNIFFFKDKKIIQLGHISLKKRNDFHNVK